MSSVVQSLWIGARLPPVQQLSIRSFLANGHPYHLYTFDPIDNVPDGAVIMDAATVLPRDAVFTYRHGFGKGSYSAFSNQFRYKLLFDKGGWWVDTDVVCLRPFEFPEEFVFATERDPQLRVTAASCAFRSPARAEYLAYCLEVCERHDKERLEWGQIGPRLMTDAIDRFGLARYCRAPEVFNPIDYFAFADVIKPRFDFGRISNSSAVHLWHQKWKEEYFDPEFAGAPDGLYAALRRQYLDPAEPSRDRTPALERHVEFLRTAIDTLRQERDQAGWDRDWSRREAATAHEQATRAGQDAASAREDADAAQRALDAAQEVLTRQTGEMQHLQQALGEARQEIQALLGSRSWRVTAPLRKVFDLLTGRGK